MHSTQDLLDALRELAGSDRKAAAMLEIAQANYSEWRTGKTWPSNERAIQIAGHLNLDPAYAVAIIQRDRARSKEARQLWARVAETFKAAGVAVVTLAALAGAAPTEARADLTKSELAAGGNTHWRRNRRSVLGVAV